MTTEDMIDGLKQMAGRCLDAKNAEFLNATADRLHALYWGTTIAEPVKRMERLSSRNRIYKKQIREMQRMLEMNRWQRAVVVLDLREQLAEMGRQNAAMVRAELVSAHVRELERDCRR